MEFCINPHFLKILPKIVFFVFFKIVINNSLKIRRPKSNFLIFYCMHCKKMENFYNTYNLILFL